LTIGVDATLIAAHSEKERAAGKLQARLRVRPAAGLSGGDPRGARWAAAPRERRLEHRRGPHDGHRRGARADPCEYIESIEILIRADFAGATHGLIDYCRAGNPRFALRILAMRYDITHSGRDPGPAVWRG
jgi:hypothetical protein